MEEITLLLEIKLISVEYDPNYRKFRDKYQCTLFLLTVLYFCQTFEDCFMKTDLMYLFREKRWIL